VQAAFVEKDFADLWQSNGDESTNVVDVSFAKVEPVDMKRTTREENPNTELPKIVFSKGDEVDANAKDAVSGQSA